MSEDQDTPTTDHDYDGIREFDNPLPTWWLVTFFATIIFAFHYWIHYEFGGGMDQKAELSQDMAQIQQLQHNHPASLDTEEDLQKLAGSAEIISRGHDLFGAKCAVCHGPELQGVIGPNLTDEYWIHGQGRLTDIALIIRSGVPDKGMPNWESQLQNEEIRALTVFVASRKGSHPVNPKAPQGEKIAN